MSSLNFAKEEITAAIGRGVRQCVVIGSRLPLCESLDISGDQPIEIFSVDGSQTDTLASALDQVPFDKAKVSLFVWLGGAGYRTVDAVVGSLSFIASLPKGSGVLLDYVTERASFGSRTQTALDGLASGFMDAGGRVKYLIQPQAVAAMLHGFGFKQILDYISHERWPGEGHLVSAFV